MWKCLELMGWWHFHDLFDFESIFFLFLCSLIFSQKKGQKDDRLQNEIKFANFYKPLPQLMQLKTKKNFDTTFLKMKVCLLSTKIGLIRSDCISKLACHNTLIKMAWNLCWHLKFIKQSVPMRLISSIQGLSTHITKCWIKPL